MQIKLGMHVSNYNIEEYLLRITDSGLSYGIELLNKPQLAEIYSAP